MTEKLDIYNSAESYQTSLGGLHQDDTVSQRNKDIVTKFLHDCEMGKTVLHRQKKKISYTTLSKYLFSLKVVLRHLKVDLESLGADEKDNPSMETFIGALERNEIKRLDGRCYAEKSKREVKVVLKKFYKWLYGNNEAFPALVSWIDTRQEYKEIGALSRDIIEQWVRGLDNIRHKALVMVLFDSGARIGELLNVRMKHVEHDEKEQCYKLRIEFSKTKRRTIWVPIATSYLKQYILNLGNSCKDPEGFLFDCGYDSLRIVLRRLSLQHVKQVVTPHDLRHSSATYYCKKLNRYELCYRYGWSMSSDMPDRYIDREGLVETTALKKVKQEKTEVVMEENQRLKEDYLVLKEKMERLEKAQQVRVEPDHIVKEVLEKLLQQHPEKMIKIIEDLEMKKRIQKIEV
jgi:integrase